MAYRLEGTFIEACDCYVVCPCWVDDDPDEGHCTGLFAWTPDDGSVIEGVPVAGRTVVAVTTHQGNRRTDRSATVLFVDQFTTDRQYDVLVAAFSGQKDGPLSGLADVSGRVLGHRRARIVVDPSDSAWCVTVAQPGSQADPLRPDLRMVRARGRPRFLDPDGGGPLSVRWTALWRGLGNGDGDVVVQRGEDLSLQVGELPGGVVELTGRSGMRGRFRYVHPRDDAGAGDAAAGDRP